MVNVKVKEILTVNIAEMVTERENISIADTLEIAYWLSNGVFAFDLIPS